MNSLQNIRSGEVPPRSAYRLTELDGIRGWAALAVVVFHLTYEIFGHLLPIYRSWWASMISGDLAVTLFFVLSGEALCASYFARGRLTSLVGLAIRRPLRLSIPVFCSILLLWILDRSGLLLNEQASHIVDRYDWLGGNGKQFAGLRHGLYFAFIGMYQPRFDDFSANPFAWTMTYEFAGSFLVFAVAPMVQYIRWPNIALALVALVCLFGATTGYMADFLAGLIFCRLRLSGAFAAIQARGWARLCAPLVIIACLLAASYSLRQRWFIYDPAIGIVLAAAIYSSRDAQAFFSSRLSRALGHISFPLYLVQWPVLVSFTSYAIIWLRGDRITVMNAAGVVVASLLVCVLVAIAFEPVEILTRVVGRRLTGLLLNDSDAAGPARRIEPVAEPMPSRLRDAVAPQTSSPVAG